MSDALFCQPGFRTAQTVCDLRAVARAAPSCVADRIATGTYGLATVEDFARLVGQHGCRLSTRAHAAMHHGLLVAATLPEDDPAAFQAATAVLLADRLQEGRGRDDLFWHWDGFQDAYDALPPAPRAAILQGYAQATREGFVPLMDPPAGQRLATRPRAQVMAGLSAVTGAYRSAAVRVSDALGDPSAVREVAGIWEDLHAPLSVSRDPEAPVLRAGFRHLFETIPTFEPFPGTAFDLAGHHLPVIPFEQ